MTLPNNWQDGQTVHGSDINAISSQINEDTNAIAELQTELSAPLILSQPTAMFCTLPRTQENEVTVGVRELNLTYFEAPSALPVANIGCLTGSTAAASVTLAKFGIYSVDPSGNLTLIAATANTTGLFAGTYSGYQAALTASVSLAQGSMYAVGYLIDAVTMPTLIGSYTVDDANLPPRICGLLTSQTDLPSSIPAGSVAHNYRVFYARLF